MSAQNYYKVDMITINIMAHAGISLRKRKTNAFFYTVKL